MSTHGIQLNAPLYAGFEEILSADALHFIALLCERFEPTRKTLLRERERRQCEISNGNLPEFLPETKRIRESEWTVASIPLDLIDRRVEITGPVSRKMVINALNSGAKVFMADFEDSNSPNWRNNIEGQINLRDAVNETISFTSPEGKKYMLSDRKGEKTVLMVRPRGWHLQEAHVSLFGEPVSASLFDFGLFFFHNAKRLIEKGTGPYFYLPKMESHLEARLWANVFAFSERTLNIPQGTVRATVLIETILAAFEMDEILYELRDYSAGLNCGRWDYIFSWIKKFIEFPEFVLPDRGQVDMLQPFMNSYVQLLIRTCHRRGIHAMGGMAAQIPIQNDRTANHIAMEKVSKDKLREVKAGHDGTWVAHPGLIPIAKEIFDQYMKGPNQIEYIPDRIVTAKDLLQPPQGTMTLEGLRANIRIGLLYLESWLRGNGCVPINHLMEDLATAEICRSQVQQWIRHRVKLTNGDLVERGLAMQYLEEEEVLLLTDTKEALIQNSIRKAKEIFAKMILSEKFEEFMSLIAYPYIMANIDRETVLAKL